MEVSESKFGFIPDSNDTAAFRVRRRFRLSKGGNPQLMIVHYTIGQSARASELFFFLITCSSYCHSHPPCPPKPARPRLPSSPSYRIAHVCERRKARPACFNATTATNAFGIRDPWNGGDGRWDAASSCNAGPTKSRDGATGKETGAREGRWNGCPSCEFEKKRQ